MYTGDRRCLLYHDSLILGAGKRFSLHILFLVRKRRLVTVSYLIVENFSPLPVFVSYDTACLCRPVLSASDIMAKQHLPYAPHSRDAFVFVLLWYRVDLSTVVLSSRLMARMITSVPHTHTCVPLSVQSWMYRHWPGHR